MEPIKGFKAMRPNMSCRGFHFKVGETYKHRGDVVPCHSGFHFCRNIEDIASYYNQECRIFEVEASGITVEVRDKIVTNTLTIIREIDYNAYIDHPHWWVRSVVASQGIGLEKLINDPDWFVRASVAAKGYYGLDILINDENASVRREVAQQSYGLELLINDSDYSVKTVAAMKLKDLENEK